MKRNPIFLITGLAFFIATAEMPHSYYQLLSLLGFGVSAYGATLSYLRKKIGWFWILGTLALMFNPLVPLSLIRESWMIVNLVSGGILCIYFLETGKNT